MVTYSTRHRVTLSSLQYLQPDYSDKELALLFEKDSEQAIEILFRLHYSYLCQAVFRVLPDENLAEDLVQEVFFELWKKHRQLRINTSFRAYLRRAAINKTLNFIRDHRRINFENQEELPLKGSLNDGIQELEASELQALIDRAIDQLPERCRIIFVLSRFEELSYAEIADHLGISVKTVENQISKALKGLRATLEPYLLGGGLSLLGIFLNF